ncbi:putative cobaltochelatase [Crenobacter cavernae]|uniref:Mg-protoporphyrin IX chelatase n=1 Tax=Crenobacter cavernae TaxID=2290923 RepID=A0A345Y9E0_9NEIS|nr:putative cobaltochelatase [Crenobacter cavernae]AXK40542.1 putative cobaltochelatase [Crenobacter cavernae]
MKHNYPFAAIVGQEQLKRALLLCAVDPTLGGVLIRGDKGTAKSTAARGLTDVLLPIQRVSGCAFNCAPEAPLAECDACQNADTLAEPSPVPFVNLPLGATEDRVLGSLDFEKALQNGRQAFKPGLLAAAHRGLLYIDEVNLLADHLVDVLLDVSAMGTNTVQREGLSVSHPARITLLGTMNQEEGELRPQLLDRFGMMVEVTAPRDPAVRTEVVRRRLAFEADPAGFVAGWQADTDALRSTIQAAQTGLAEVALPDSLFAFISQLCCEFEVASLRADIVMHKAARAMAALDGRDAVTAEDVRNAAELVLPHRRRRKPFEQTGLDRERLDELTQQASAPPPPPPETESPSGDDTSDAEPSEDEINDDAQPGTASEQLFATGAASEVGRIEVRALQAHEASGRRSSSAGARRGHYVRAVPNEAPSQLAVDATLRSALLRNPNEFAVTRADLHDKVRVGKQANLILLVVDASGSMAAKRRMEAVKGCVLGLLQDAYQRRDQVAVIAFRGSEAELVLPPTRQVEQAERALSELPTGGRTPLAHALQLAVQTLAQHARQDNLTPLLVVLSDGRANIALDTRQDPWSEALALAAGLADQGTPALVLDTEEGYVRLGRARELAEALQGEYLPLDSLSADQLTLTIRERLGR